MIRVQREDFDPGRELAALTAGRTDLGGAVLFCGLVRDRAGATRIGAMTLEHYPGMTEKMLADIEAAAHKRWPLSGSLIVHRYGKLAPGDRIVLVITGSAHRQAAFEANMFLVDWLKTKAPFWKLEEGPSGAAWVEARTGDDAAAARWTRSTPSIGAEGGDAKVVRSKPSTRSTPSIGAKGGDAKVVRSKPSTRSAPSAGAKGGDAKVVRRKPNTSPSKAAE